MRPIAEKIHGRLTNQELACLEKCALAGMSAKEDHLLERHCRVDRRAKEMRCAIHAGRSRTYLLSAGKKQSDGSSPRGLA